MTYKEALEVCRDLPPTNYSEACKKALEKQIPVKINTRSSSYGERDFCPICSCVIENCHAHFCIRCGQALDWSNENEVEF